MSLMGLCALILFFWRCALGKMHMLILVLCILLLVGLLTLGQVMVDFAINKFVYESAGNSSRGQFLISLMQAQKSAGLFNLMFGHGLTSLSHLEQFGMRSEDVLFRISNNMFLDILWESGVIGIFAAMTFFIILLKQGMALQRKMHNRLSLSLLLVCQMLITALYRSEYISLHYAWVLLLVLWSISWEKQVFHSGK